MAFTTVYPTYSLEFLIDEVQDFMVDLTGTRFDKREVINAINNSIRVLPPKWTTPVEDKTTLAYDQDTHEYTIPSAFSYLSRILFEPVLTTDPPYEVYDFYTIGNRFYFKKKYYTYDTKQMYLYGEGPVSAFNVVKGEDGVANGTTTFTDANAKFSTGSPAVSPGDNIFITQSSNNDAAVSQHTVNVVNSDTQLTLSGSPSSASSCQYIIADLTDTTDVPFSYLLYKSAYFLYLTWWHKGVSKDVDASARKSQYLNEQAMLELEESKGRHMPRSR